MKGNFFILFSVKNEINNEHLVLDYSTTSTSKNTYEMGLFLFVSAHLSVTYQVIIFPDLSLTGQFPVIDIKLDKPAEPTVPEGGCSC